MCDSTRLLRDEGRWWRGLRWRSAPIHIPDALADPEYTWHEGRRLGGFRTMLGIPLLREGTCVGVMALTRTTPQPFSGAQIALVTTFAAQAVIAIENTRLLNELRQRTDDLTESLEQQTATTEVLKVISSSPGELEPVFEAMLENATRICEAKFGNLFLCEGEVFRIGAAYGAPPAYVDICAANRRSIVNPTRAATRAAVTDQSKSSHRLTD